MSLDNGAADGQAHPYPVRLRGIEGLEYLVELFRWYSSSGIRNADLDFALWILGASDRHHCFMVTRRCFSAVHYQIEQDLLKLCTVTENFDGLRGNSAMTSRPRERSSP